MKKLMIAAVIVCAAAMAQATAVNWKQDVTQIDGDFSTGAGNFAPAGWQMYLFDSNKAEGTTYLQMQSLLEAATTETGYAEWKTAMGGYAGFGAIASDQTFRVDGINMTEVAASFTGYAVILDAETLDEATYAFLVAEETFAKEATTTVLSFGDDYDSASGNFINALDYSANPKTGWTAVGAAPIPEPTSGLLLLLGVAGLALRRRRA